MAGKNKVYCMLVNETCGQKEFLQSVSMDTDCDIYNNAYTAGGNTGRIGQCLKKMADIIGNKYAVINIVLPDPVTALCVYRPSGSGSMASWRDILKLKSSEKLCKGHDGLSVWMSALNKTGAKPAGAFAFSSKKINTEVIRVILNDSGLSPSACSPGIVYVNDAFFGPANNAKAAVLLIEPEYWTFFLHGNDGCPLYMISKWFNTGTINTSVLKDVISEIERKLRAYSASSGVVEIEKFYTAGLINEPEVTGQIKGRFNCECVELKIPVIEKNGQKQGIAGMPVSLIAAAGL
jgi:hypothetical protein